MISNSLIERVRRHEGLVLVPHPDAKGMWAIGYGHDFPPSDLARYKDMTPAAAELQLQKDLTDAEYSARRSVPWMDKLDELRQEVLIEMVFQMGAGGLLQFKKMLMRLSAGDYAGAAAEGLMSQWHAQTPKRCEELMYILKTGKDDYVEPS